MNKYFVKIFDGTKENNTLIRDHKKEEKIKLRKEYEVLNHRKEVIFEYMHKAMNLYDSLKLKNGNLGLFYFLETTDFFSLARNQTLTKNIIMGKKIVRTITNDYLTVVKKIQGKVMLIRNRCT